MSITSYFQQHTAQVLRTEGKVKLHHLKPQMMRILHAVLGLQDEIGETAKAVKAHLYYGAPLDVQNLKEELGDLSWYFCLLCDAVNLTIEDVLAANIRKLRARYPDKFTEECAQNRNLDAEKQALERKED